jgi:hypothetical protein
MPRVAKGQQALTPTEVAFALANALEQRGYEYALGGALALGYWAEPRSTVDVDLTLYLSPESPAKCVQVLQEVGCELSPVEAMKLIDEHGFCRTKFHLLRVDVFFPTIPFYEAAKARRRLVPLRDGHVQVWDAETLAVFKMMFFREKDLLDLKRIVANQKTGFDGEWVRKQLVEIYGTRDVRIGRWDEIFSETPS